MGTESSGCGLNCLGNLDLRKSRMSNRIPRRRFYCCSPERLSIFHRSHYLYGSLLGFEALESLADIRVSRYCSQRVWNIRQSNWYKSLQQRSLVNECSWRYLQSCRYDSSGTPVAGCNCFRRMFCRTDLPDGTCLPHRPIRCSGIHVSLYHLQNIIEYL